MVRLSTEARRRTTYIYIGMFFFIGGVEYAVILPTMWLYVHERFSAESYFFGLILSAFSFSGMFSSPIMGRFTDIYKHKVKAMILFANLWEIAGNILYFMGFSKWSVLTARLLSGIGSGVSACIVADVARATTSEERTAVMSLIMGCTQIGLVFGPGFNLFLRECDFYIGPFKVDSYTAPGVFMAFLWILMEMAVVCMYYDLNKEVVICDSSVYIQCDKQYADVGPANSDESVAPTENTLCTDARREQESEVTVVPAIHSYTWSFHYNEYMREEVIVLLACVFNGMFMQTSLETMVTPLTQKYLKWAELENSLMYCACGVEILITFALVRFLSKRFQDRSLLLLGFCSEVLALSWLLYYLPAVYNGDPTFVSFLVAFIIGTVLDVFGLPFLIVCSISLYSKVTRPETQGFSQGLRRTVVGVATIIGPLWAGSLLSRPYIMVGVMLGLMVMGTAMLLLSFRHLKISESTGPGTPADERSPLLQNGKA